jgi:hypothetical protein
MKENMERKSITKIRRALGLLTLCIAMVIGLMGCSKQFDCDPAMLILVFQGKDQTQLQDFKVYQYAKGNNFILPQDSLIVSDGAGVYYKNAGGAVEVFFNPSVLKIQPDHDWKILLSATTVNGGMSDILISGIMEMNQTMKCKHSFGRVKGSCECMNTLNSCKLWNTTLSSFSESEFNGIRGYRVVIPE